MDSRQDETERLQRYLSVVGRLTAELRDQTTEAARLDKLIWANLEDIGNGA